MTPDVLTQWLDAVQGVGALGVVAIVVLMLWKGLLYTGSYVALQKQTCDETIQRLEASREEWKGKAERCQERLLRTTAGPAEG